MGKRRVEVIHIQTICRWYIHFLPSQYSDLLNYRSILDCFSIILGLEINYSKSIIIPICCHDQWVENISNFLKCMVQLLPLKYLGILLDDNPRRLHAWKLVIEKIKKKLAGWKASLLSRARRLVLIKAVLNNMPLYYLGLFKMPKSVLKRIMVCSESSFGVGVIKEKVSYLLSGKLF